MPVTDEPVLPVASALLIALGDQLEASDAPVCAAEFGFGLPPPADNCCDCSSVAADAPRSGHAWVRVGQIWPTRPFPNPIATPLGGNGCDDDAGLGVAITLGVYRCAPTLDSAGNPPSGADIAIALDRQLRDAQLLRAAISVALGGDGGLDLPHIPGTWEPREPAGGCMGGMVTVTVAVPWC